MKMTAKPGQVRLIEGQPQPKKRPAAPKTGPAPTLHLERRRPQSWIFGATRPWRPRGVVENYLDAAVMAKLETVTIIHGKGTGPLRKAVHEILRRSKVVKSFRLGRYGEGEAGVTVVELK